jgi:hypothetical protein
MVTIKRHIPNPPPVYSIEGISDEDFDFLVSALKMVGCGVPRPIKNGEALAATRILNALNKGVVAT